MLEFINGLFKIVFNFIQLGEGSMEVDFIAELFTMIKRQILVSQNYSFLSCFIHLVFIIAFEKTPMSSVEVFFCFFQSSFDNVNFSQCEEPREQKDRIITTKFVLFFSDKAIKIIMGLLDNEIITLRSP